MNAFPRQTTVLRDRETPGGHDVPAVQPRMAPRGRIYDSILDTVGGTPLVRLPRLEAEEGLDARLALKLEFFNPLGSVKDRIGLAMIEDAERRGIQAPGVAVTICSARAMAPAMPCAVGVSCSSMPINRSSSRRSTEAPSGMVTIRR